MSCKFEGCGKQEFAQGYCSTHYKRIQRHGDVNHGRPPDWGVKEAEIKARSLAKPTEPVWKRQGFEDSKAWARHHAREYRKNNPDMMWEKELKKHFKIGIKDYTAMLESQNGVCAICKQPERILIKGKLLRLSVDHCHKTGKIRGLLCSHCNHAIGKFEDNIVSLKAAIDYLENHNATTQRQE